MPKLTFASDQLPVELDSRKRFKLWRDMWVASYGAAEMAHADDRPFFARTEILPIDQCAVFKLETTADYWERTPEHVRRDGQDNFLVTFFRHRGRHSVSHAGREHVLTAGAVLTQSQGRPCRSDTDGDCSLICASVPLDLVRQAAPGAGGELAQLLDPKSPAVRHLERYTAFLLQSDELSEDPALAASTSSTLTDLIALAIGATGDAAELARGRGLQAARIQDILAMISENFADPGFSLQAVATKLGLSPRYVQELTHTTGSSLTERVIEQRLQKARLMLSDPRNDRMRISDIALACGFNEVSYFNRRFRRRFGSKPKELRGSREI